MCQLSKTVTAPAVLHTVPVHFYASLLPSICAITFQPLHVSPITSQPSVCTPLFQISWRLNNNCAPPYSRPLYNMCIVSDLDVAGMSFLFLPLLLLNSRGLADSWSNVGIRTEAEAFRTNYLAIAALKNPISTSAGDTTRRKTSWFRRHRWRREVSNICHIDQNRPNR